MRRVHAAVGAGSQAGIATPSMERVDGVDAFGRFSRTRRKILISTQVKIPNLTADGTETKAKAVCKPLGLSVRGTGGEHTPIGADGTVDISPSKRLFIKERDIIAKLYSGISDLMVEEKKAPRRWR